MEDIGEDIREIVTERTKKMFNKKFHGKNEGKLIEFLKKFSPEKMKHLEHLKKENKDLYLHTKKMLYHEMKELHELKERNPLKFKHIMIMRELSRESHRIAHKYNTIKNSEEKKKLKDSLYKVLNKIFNYKIEMNKQEILTLANEVKRLEKRLNKQILKKERLIKKRMQEMLHNEEDEFEWD